MSPAGAHVAVVGSLHLDLMVEAPRLPRTGETLIGDRWWWKPGGKGGNQAMAAVRHGARTVMVGCVGRDDQGDRLLDHLASAGVVLTHVRVVEQGSGISVAIQQADGDYGAVVVSGANRALDAAQVRASADAIVESRVLLLQQEIGADANVAAARLARERAVIVVLNAAPARPLGEMVGLVDVLVVNGVEAEMLGAAAVTDLASAAEAARVLRSLAPGVIVTAGGAGLAAITGDTAVTLAAHSVADPQSHGAGDTFVGALAARLAMETPFVDALAYANAAAALHVGTPEADRAAHGPPDVWRLVSGTGVDAVP